MLRFAWLLMALPAAALGCSCVEAPATNSCPGYPDPLDTNSAIFVGRVLAVDAAYPADSQAPFLQARRVRMEVTEALKGAGLGPFELFTGIGGGDCGIPFTAGESYLVSAHRESEGSRWTAGICGGTQRLGERTSESLERLRAWKRGDASGYLYGQLLNATSENRSPVLGLALRLTSGKFEKWVTSGANGNFDFGELPRGLYHLEIAGPGWITHPEYPSPADLNLGAGGCVNFVWFLKRAKGK